MNLMNSELILNHILLFYKTHLNELSWGTIFFVGTIILYFFGVKSEWQELRKIEGLTSSIDNKPPKYRTKNVSGNKIYRYPCIKLFLFSSIVSLTICLFYWYTIPYFNIKSVKDFIGIGIFVSPVFAMFIGVPIESNKDWHTRGHIIFRNAFSFISYIKRKVLLSIITSEQKHLYYIVKEKYLKPWFEKWNNEEGTKIGILLLRVNSNYLYKIAPEEAFERIADLKRELLMLYSKKDAALYNEIKRFFTKEVTEAGMNFEDVIELLNDVDTISDNRDLAEITGLIERAAKDAKELSDDTFTEDHEMPELDFETLNIESIQAF